MTKKSIKNQQKRFKADLKKQQENRYEDPEIKPFKMNKESERILERSGYKSIVER